MTVIFTALHPQKTKCVVHGSNEPLNVYLRQVKIYEVKRGESAKLLGIVIEPNLRWQIQLSNVAEKIKKALYCFCRSKKNLEQGSKN